MVSAPSGHRLVPAVVATAFLLLAPVAHAQQVGVKAGVNFASLTPEEDEDPDSSRRLGPVGGVWVRIAPSARVAFQVEGLFSEKGVKFEAPQIGPDAVDLGLVGGLGVEFGRAQIEARYTHGLRHINTDDNGDEDRIKNRVFSVIAGFRYP